MDLASSFIVGAITLGAFIWLAGNIAFGGGSHV